MAVSIRRFLNVQPGEGRLTFLLFALIFLLGIAFNFVETSVFPLFLSEFDSGTLPYLYIINGVVAVILTTIYLKLGKWVSFGRQLLVNLAFLLLLIAGYWLALTLVGGRPVIFALPVLFQLVVNLGQLAFWTLAARLLNLRQSKRLLGVIGAGLWVAIVLTGFLIPPIVRAIGTVNLLLIAFVGMLAALILMVFVTRYYRDQLAATETTATRPSGSAPVASVLRSPYVLLMFGLTIVSWLAFFFVDNIFFNRVGDRFPSEVEVSAFLGLYLAGLGIFTLINNAFLAGPIINRYGVRAGLLVLPLSLLIVTGAFSIVGTVVGIVPLLFWLATLNRVLDLAFQFSIDQSAQTILYQPLPASERTRVQTIDGGIVRMTAIGLAGVLLLLLNQVLSFDVVQLAYVLLLIVVLWLFGVFLIAKLYPGVLSDALARRRLSGVTLSLKDSQSIQVLKETLNSPRPGQVLYALRLLDDNAPEALPSVLPDLLSHPSADVRLESLRRIEASRTATNPELLLSTMTEDSDPAVRGAAIRSLAATATGHDDLIIPRLHSEVAAERMGAMTGLLRYGHPEAHAAAEEALSALVSSPSAIDRLEAVRVINDWAGPDACAQLARLVNDPDLAVRRAVLEAIGQNGCEALWPVVIECLHDPALRRSAADALIAGGESALPSVATALNDATHPEMMTSDLVRISGRMGGATTAARLLPYLDHPSGMVRNETLLALVHNKYHAGDAQSAAAIRRRITAETQHASWLLAGLRDCAPEPRLNYLSEVLAERFEETRKRIYLLLSCLYNRENMLQVAESLRYTGPETTAESRRAYALEMLDVTLPGDLKALVMPLSEEIPAGSRLSRLGNAFAQPEMSPVDRVKTLATTPQSLDRWSHIASVQAAGRIHCTSPAMEAMLSGYVSSDDPLLREVAAWTSAQLREPDTSISVSTGGKIMLSTIEKVILLKDVDLFAETPDELLAEVAEFLVESELLAGQPVFAKGDRGESLYIIASGLVRVHDGEHLIDHLGESEVFGEMALLDAEPRMASVTVETDVTLLRLDQDSFYDLIETRPEVARGVIRVLSGRLRNRVREVAQLRINS